MQTIYKKCEQSLWLVNFVPPSFIKTYRERQVGQSSNIFKAILRPWISLIQVFNVQNLLFQVSLVYCGNKSEFTELAG